MVVTVTQKVVHHCTSKRRYCMYSGGKQNIKMIKVGKCCHSSYTCIFPQHHTLAKVFHFTDVNLKNFNYEIKTQTKPSHHPHPLQSFEN